MLSLSNSLHVILKLLLIRWRFCLGRFGAFLKVASVSEGVVMDFWTDRFGAIKILCLGKTEIFPV